MPVRPLVQFMRERLGYQVLPYIDDSLICGTKSSSKFHYYSTTADISRLIECILTHHFTFEYVRVPYYLVRIYNSEVLDFYQSRHPSDDGGYHDRANSKAQFRANPRFILRSGERQSLVRFLFQRARQSNSLMMVFCRSHIT